MKGIVLVSFQAALFACEWPSNTTQAPINYVHLGVTEKAAGILAALLRVQDALDDGVPMQKAIKKDSLGFLYFFFKPANR